MREVPSDQGARDRFTNDWSANLAVVANAGSGKTTAISERLATMALAPGRAEMLARTAVVTYTKKAAAQIGQGARSALLRRMADAGGADAEALARLDRVLFGTIHSFCLVLARRHGSMLGIHLNPTVVGEDEDAHWQEFLEQDPMTFASPGAPHVAGFLRHAPLDAIFDLTNELDHAKAERLLGRPPAPVPPGPPPGVLEEILAAKPTRKGAATDSLLRNKVAALEWWRRYTEESGPLPILEPEGKAAGIEERFDRLFAPLKQWLAAAGALLAAELSLRYRSWRLDRGLQTYADQVESALSILGNDSMLERIRGEGWRVILDEAQDTDPKQFEVLVEITRPPGAPLRTWPGRGGAGPRPGHFCMVGDAQQGIYSRRADIANFRRHVDAIAREAGGAELTFDVTFRTPRRIARLLNETLPAAFGPGREHNLGPTSPGGAKARLLQVPYEPLVPGPASIEGAAWLLRFEAGPASGRTGVDARLSEEVRQLAQFLAAGRPGAVGAAAWGEVCIIAPRVGWLAIIKDELEAAGLKVALQTKRNRNGDNPAYAWVCGLLAVVCDPENTFEWVGVLREIFLVSDSLIAAELGRGAGIRWEDPGACAQPIADAVAVLGPFIDRSDQEGESLERFAAELAAACGLAEKARLVDPEGGLEDELARLLARASELSLDGAGPREWLRDLLGAIDEFRPSGRPSSDAINLTSSHSAKGLEWPVVIPVGMWRPIKFKVESGLRIVSEHDGVPELVFDNHGVSPEARDAKKRAEVRELVRLLYVTLTRPLRALVIPWTAFPLEKYSFAEIWGLDPGLLDPIPRPVAEAPAAVAADGAAASPLPPAPAGAVAAPARPFPRRILPHELAAAPDSARAARHEASLDQPLPVNDGADPLEYGVWWHETLENMPWTGDACAVDAHGAASLARAAELGFGARAAGEWGRLLASEPWSLLREARWNRVAEVGIFAPLAPDGWIDGVIDLVLHDPEACEVWIVDWKTNRQRLGEDDAALLGRLSTDYEGQLAAYGSCTSGFFKDCRVRLWVYSTVAGRWTGVGKSG